MIDKFLAFRAASRRAYQKIQGIVEFAFRFLLAYFAYDQITDTLSYSEILSEPVLKVAFGFVGAFLPPIVTVVFCIFIAVYEIFSEAPLLAAIVVVLFAIVYCFAARFSGKFSYAVVAIPILFKFNLQYIIPLILGLVAGPMAVFPAASGVAIYYIMIVTQGSVDGAHVTKADEILALYTDFLKKLIDQKEAVIIIAIFTVVIVAMWIVRKFRFSLVFELTIVFGSLLMIMGFLLANIKLGLSFDVKNVVVGTLLSMLVVFVVQFFRTVLDYAAVESVQFEDDDYYYYVKAVPKLEDHVVSEEERAEETGASSDVENKEDGSNSAGSADEQEDIRIAPAEEPEKINIQESDAEHFETTKVPVAPKPVPKAPVAKKPVSKPAALKTPGAKIPATRPAPKFENLETRRFGKDFDEELSDDPDDLDLDSNESSVYNMVFSGLNRKRKVQHESDEKKKD